MDSGPEGRRCKILEQLQFNKADEVSAISGRNSSF